MPQVIKHFNDPNHAVTLGGHTVQREDKLFLPSYQQWFPVLHQSMHFCFRDPTVARGTTLFCTCGAPAIIVGYEAYKHMNSFIGSEVIACHYLVHHREHSDGSHE